jgi:hypothetical protein
MSFRDKLSNAASSIRSRLAPTQEEKIQRYKRETIETRNRNYAERREVTALQQRKLAEQERQDIRAEKSQLRTFLPAKTEEQKEKKRQLQDARHKRKVAYIKQQTELTQAKANLGKARQNVLKSRSSPVRPRAQLGNDPIFNDLMFGHYETQPASKKRRSSSGKKSQSKRRTSQRNQRPRNPGIMDLRFAS